MAGQNPFDEFSPSNPVPQGENPQQQPMNDGPKQDLPNATGGLVLGILALVFSLCYGLFGIILGIIGMVLSNQAITLATNNPGRYNPQGLKNAQAGRVCSMIGLILGVVVLLISIVYVVAVMNEVGHYRYRRSIFD